MMNVLAELEQTRDFVETDEIKESRKFCQEDNESRYVNKGIKSLSFMLLGLCDQKVYEGEEIKVYFDILDTRNFLKEKYAELADTEALKFKEADEALPLGWLP